MGVGALLDFPEAEALEQVGPLFQVLALKDEVRGGGRTVVGAVDHIEVPADEDFFFRVELVKEVELG